MARAEPNPLPVWKSDHGSLGKPMVHSGSGGAHYYFAYERLTDVAQLDGFAAGVDLKGTGDGNSCVIAPPTRRDKPITRGAVSVG